MGLVDSLDFAELYRRWMVLRKFFVVQRSSEFDFHYPNILVFQPINTVLVNILIFIYNYYGITGMGCIQSTPIKSA
jgi:hypothetical protein